MLNKRAVLNICNKFKLTDANAGTSASPNPLGGNLEMRLTLIILIIMTFCCCGQRNEQTKHTQYNVSDYSINDSGTPKTNEKLKNNSTELTMLELKKHEDSLRSEKNQSR